MTGTAGDGSLELSGSGVTGAQFRQLKRLTGPENHREILLTPRLRGAGARGGRGGYDAVPGGFVAPGGFAPAAW